MPKRLPYEILILGALALGSCGSSATRRFTAGDADTLNVADVNSRNAIARVEALASQVEEVESGLDTLRQTVTANADAANSNSEAWNKNAEVINQALDRIERLESRLGM